MKKGIILCVWALLVCLCAGLAVAEGAISVNGELAPKSREKTLAMRDAAAAAYLGDPALLAELSGEITREEIENPFAEEEPETISLCALTHEGQTMRFLMKRMGEPDGEGLYPLYITLHGGGEGAPEGNDQQWFQMYEYYRQAVTDGIYIACRGITDTWDLHFQSASYPLYDRLIQAMICLEHADPNRVYLLGFSAGGDGVYQIAPRMADRFAAANMSSGHPNGVSLQNLANCPLSIQVGVRDYYSEDALRCIRAAEMEKTLSDLRDRLGSGYAHQVLVHVPAGHNFNDVLDLDPAGKGSEEVLADPTAYAAPDLVESMMSSFLDALQAAVGEEDVGTLSYLEEGVSAELDEAIRQIVTEEYHLETRRVNASAVDYVSRFTRDPAPDAVVWDLGTRAASRPVTSFYWLKAEPGVNQGVITASIVGDNTIRIQPERVNGDFSILVNPELLDVSRPIRILTPEGEFSVAVNPSEETLRSSMRETGDPYLSWVAEIPYSLLHR